MKKFYFLLVFFIVVKIDAQTINFTSSYFKERLVISDSENTKVKDKNGQIIKIDENKDGEIQLSEALRVVELDISSAYVDDMGGIEYFTNLEKLICPSTGIKTLYLNALQELKYLDCSYNPITSLDVSQLKKLEILICVHAWLDSVNVAGLDKLHHLHLDQNALSDLDLSGLVSLKHIQCQNNVLKILNLTLIKM